MKSMDKVDGSVYKFPLDEYEQQIQGQNSKLVSILISKIENRKIELIKVIKAEKTSPDISELKKHYDCGYHNGLQEALNIINNLILEQ
jgi:hypothetical protein